MDILKRAITPVVVLALAVGAALVILGSGNDPKTMTAYFPQAISLYEGSDVKVLGVDVGKVDTVEPEGTKVKVTLHYDADVQVPSDAKAVIVSPAIVGDRYIQLTPAFEPGEQELADDAVVHEEDLNGVVPLELDQIYSSLDQLTVALGPNGANKKGALTDVLQVTAANFGGQGLKFHQTIKNFSKLSTTLNDNKQELFGSAAKLQKFITKLADNDTTVRRFNGRLARVANVLSGDRRDLASSLHNLATALTEVGSFVKQNKTVLTRNISGLNRVAKTIVKNRSQLEETLRVAPLALNNLEQTYNPQAGTLDTNANLGLLAGNIASDPKMFLCDLVSANDPSGSACDLIKTLPLPRTGPFGAGSGSEYGVKADPTLGGLVGRTQR